MLRFTAMMKLSRGVRGGVDLFASNYAGQDYCEKTDPDHDTNNFKHVTPRHDAFPIGRKVAGGGSKPWRRI
jgi:hypothetical protein